MKKDTISEVYDLTVQKGGVEKKASIKPMVKVF